MADFYPMWKCKWRICKSKISDIAIKSFKKRGKSDAVDGIEVVIHFGHDIEFNNEISASFQSDSESNKNIIGKPFFLFTVFF